MALLKDKVTSIPEGAVILSESEAIDYQIKILHRWKDTSDVWAIKYGSSILASLSAIGGIYLNSYYRNKLKLLNYGKISSYLPICVLPACTTYLLHTEVIVPRVLLQKECAVCTEISASALQAFTGCVLPAILAPLSTFGLASKYITYDIPYVTKEPMKVLQLYKRITKPISNTLLLIFLGQALAASFVTYLESRSIQTCNEKLMKMEYEIEQMIQ